MVEFKIFVVLSHSDTRCVLLQCYLAHLNVYYEVYNLTYICSSLNFSFYNCVYLIFFYFFYCSRFCHTLKWISHVFNFYHQFFSHFSSVQFSCSVISDTGTPWIAARQAFLSITNSWSLLKPMFIELVMPSNHLILCHPHLFLPAIFPNISIFSNESALRIWCPKYWSFSFTISPYNDYWGLISFRMGWLDLLADQGILKSHPQHHSSKASIIQHSAFFIVQLSHPCMTTGKTIALTRGLLTRG